MLIVEPWNRVRMPVEIPDGDDLASALLGLDQVDFAELVRSNLLPRSGECEARERWERLWAAIDRDDQLAERTFDVLEDFIDACDAAGDVAEGRVGKFRNRCEDAWQRLQKDPPDEGPLSWAGRSALGFNAPGRRVIDQLVQAIASHREIRRGADEAEADRQLWSVLRRLNLDPGRSRR